MGVKFATGSQKRTTRTQRDRGSLDLGHDTQAIDCASCGVEVSRGDAFTLEAGEICPACFIAQEPPAAQVDYAGPFVLFASWSLLAGMVSGIVLEFRAWFVGMAGLGWGLFGMLAMMLGVFATLSSLRLVRTSRPLTPEDDAKRVDQALGTAGFILGLLATLGAIVTTVYPYVVGLNQVPF